ncbi:MAG TPA: VOC family protein [Polyangia bacterium]|nr:VOC family protein [Polyangia bacterium]
MAKKQPIVHVEYRTRDAHKLKTFYGSVFEWKFDDVMPGYTMFDAGNKEIGGGIMHMAADQQMPTGVSNYIGVKSLVDTEAKINAHGGKILMSNQEVPGMGHFSVFTDVDGNFVGIFQELDKKTAKKAAKAEKKAKKKEKKKAKKA